MTLCPATHPVVPPGCNSPHSNGAPLETHRESLVAIRTNGTSMMCRFSGNCMYHLWPNFQPLLEHIIVVVWLFVCSYFITGLFHTVSARVALIFGRDFCPGAPKIMTKIAQNSTFFLRIKSREKYKLGIKNRIWPSLADTYNSTIVLDQKFGFINWYLMTGQLLLQIVLTTQNVCRYIVLYWYTGTGPGCSLFFAWPSKWEVQFLLWPIRYSVWHHLSMICIGQCQISTWQGTIQMNIRSQRSTNLER